MNEEPVAIPLPVSRTWLGALVLAVIAAAGCAAAAPPAARPPSSFGQNLSLAMSFGRAVAVRDTSVTAEFALTNNGPAAFDGCFAPSWGVSMIVGGSHDSGYYVRVDRPKCEEKLMLSPGQKITWSKKVPLTDLRAGTAKVTGWVKVVDPACDEHHNCQQTSVATPVMTVAIGGGS